MMSMVTNQTFKYLSKLVSLGELVSLLRFVDLSEICVINGFGTLRIDPRLLRTL